jgi:hypothetical protein
MPSLCACLRTMSRTTSGELIELMAHMNRLIYEASAINRYATFFFGIFVHAGIMIGQLWPGVIN